MKQESPPSIPQELTSPEPVKRLIRKEVEYVFLGDGRVGVNICNDEEVVWAENLR